MSSTDVDPAREVRRMHVLFEDWFGGIRNDLGPFEESTAASFTGVTPGGTLHDRAGYLRALEETRDAFDGPVGIELSEITVQRSLYGIHQLTFEKRVHSGGETEVSTCSVWLRETDQTSTGLQWLHVQETPTDPTDDED